MQATIADIRRGDRFIWSGRTYLAVADACPTGSRSEYGQYWTINFLNGRPQPGPDGVVHQGSSMPDSKMVRHDFPVEITERGVSFMWLHEKHAAEEPAVETDDPAQIAERRLALISASKEYAVRTLTEVDAARDTAIRVALAEGVLVRDLMRMTDLSRARIYQIRDGRR